MQRNTIRIYWDGNECLNATGSQVMTLQIAEMMADEFAGIDRAPYERQVSEYLRSHFAKYGASVPFPATHIVCGQLEVMVNMP